MDYWDEYSKMNTLSARMTGYFSALAVYYDEIPTPIRKKILQFLIDSWKETQPESSVIQTWVKDWEEKMKEISA